MRPIRGAERLVPFGTVSPMFYRFLGALGKLLIAAGVILLLFTGFQLWGTGFTEAAEQKELTTELASELGVDTSPELDADAVADDITTQLETIDPTTAEATPPPEVGNAAGFIEIPKIGLKNKAFVEGTDKKDLRRGPGHYAGTPLPGQAGNASIAGHRSTYGAPFNRLDELEPGDPINVYTPQGKFVYEVMAPEPDVSSVKGPGWFAVRPWDSWVIDNTDDNRLTLTACHPKYSAKQRIIVQARLLGEAAAAVPPDETPSDPDGSPDESVVSEPTQEDLIAGDASELGPTLTYGGILGGTWLAVIAAVSWLRRRTKWAWAGYLAYLPVGSLLLWNAFFHLDRYLPSF